MKTFLKLSLLSVAFLMLTEGKAQLKTPQPSTPMKFETTVGLTAVTVDYSRPSMKGRTVFGDLVPFDAIWRTGANASTKITFGDDVNIAGTDVKKGTYALYTKPGKKVWEVYFYSETTNWGNPKVWDEAKVVAKATVTPQAINQVETFTINVGNVSNAAFDLELMWEKVLVPVKITLATDKKVSDQIAKVLAGPSGGDYYSAARYYFDEKKELKQALAWINKGIDMGTDMFYVLRLKSLIQADLGDFKGALETAKKSLEKSKEAGNDDYVKMNQDSIDAWSKK